MPPYLLYVNDHVLLEQSTSWVQILSTPNRHHQFVRIENLAAQDQYIRVGEPCDPCGEQIMVQGFTKMEMQVTLPGIVFSLHVHPDKSPLFHPKLRITLVDDEGCSDLFSKPRIIPSEEYFVQPSFLATVQENQLEETEGEENLKTEVEVEEERENEIEIELKESIGVTEDHTVSPPPPPSSSSSPASSPPASSPPSSPPSSSPPLSSSSSSASTCSISSSSSSPASSPASSSSSSSSSSASACSISSSSASSEVFFLSEDQSIVILPPVIDIFTDIDNKTTHTRKRTRDKSTHEPRRPGKEGNFKNRLRFLVSCLVIILSLWIWMLVEEDNVIVSTEQGDLECLL